MEKGMRDRFSEPRVSTIFMLGIQDEYAKESEVKCPRGR